MSSTGVWVVGVVPDAEALALPERLFHLVRPGDRTKPPGFAEALAWWSNGGDREPFFEPPVDPSKPVSLTPAARRLADLVEDANPPTEAVEAMRDAGTALMPDAEGPGLYLATARKANPVAALHYGLGAQRSAMLPGWFGDFLLSASEVRNALPRAEEALLFSPSERSAALTRITAWMTGMGDDTDFGAAALVDAPLRVLRHAAATGSGAAAFSRWY
ncbi:hypothetical protein ACGFX4_04375 [Kitasatospora sp. NPDC048365]|uniref:hypothetical protein n=1 Tax=Kitasatospora sp. NPDC048365 TaxID=3364050 RepID=UPI00371E6D80